MKRGKKEMKRKGTWVEIWNFLVLKICMWDSPKRITNTFAFASFGKINLIWSDASNSVRKLSEVNFQWMISRHQVFPRFAGIFYFLYSFFYPWYMYFRILAPNCFELCHLASCRPSVQCNFLFSMLNVIFYLFLLHLVFSFAVTFCLRLTTLPVFHYSSYCYRKNWINYGIRPIYSQTKWISPASRMKNAITNWYFE